MATYSTNEFKAGLKIMIDADPCAIIENEFVKPGKGQAFSRVRIRNLKTGRVIERTYKSGESVESADVIEMEMQYLYTDGEFWHFMVPDTYEQYQADKTAVSEAMKWLKDQDICTMTLWNDAPLTIVPPNFVELSIADTDPGADHDILSVDDDGEDLWIEVKATTGRDGRFRWPKAEFEKAVEKRDRYILWRV